MLRPDPNIKSYPNNDVGDSDPILVVFFAVVCGISFFYASEAVQNAEIKDFWTDEIHALENTVKEQSFFSILIQGARRQSSVAPLYYAGLKILDTARNISAFQNIPFNIYYRLDSVLYTLLAGMLSLCFLGFRIYQQKGSLLVSILQYALLLVGLWTFFFPYYNFYYSIESRPYALWNALWFLTLVSFLFYQKHMRLWLTVILSLLAATSVAAVYQMFILGLCFLAVNIARGRHWREVLVEELKLFVVPVCIALYYIMIGSKMWDYPDTGQYIPQFLKWWSTKRLIPSLSLLGILLTVRTKALKEHTIVFSTVLLLYLASPLMNYVTVKHGLFFAMRQYLHFDLIYPIFFISLALSIPVHFENFTGRKTLKIWTYVRWAGIIIFTIASAVLAWPSIKQNKLMRLNSFRPQSFAYLKNVAEGQGDMDEKELKKYLFYYKQVNRHFPKRAEVQGMMGFCYYYLGEHSKAVRSYEKARRLNPEFFWYDYNLGVIHLKAGNFGKALTFFEKASRQDVKKTVSAIVVSQRVYLPILRAYEIPLEKILLSKLKVALQQTSAIILFLQKNDMTQIRNATVLSKIATKFENLRLEPF